MSRPTGPQIEAADPAISAWVGANAGSGKTRVLTQRVARLLLAGAAPERILCLTYTKAAAAEMQDRLFATLGTWALAPVERLAAEIEAVTGEILPPGADQRLAAARRLFARALETPGGLRIQTIHAFCDAVLRRFPLEAGIGPRFEVMDDREKAAMLLRLRAAMAEDAEAGRDPAFDHAASRLNEGGIDELVAAVMDHRLAFAGDMEAALAASFPAEALVGDLESCLATLSEPWVGALAEGLSAHGGKTEQAVAEALMTWRAAPGSVAEMRDRLLIGGVLTAKGQRRAPRGYPSKAVEAAGLAGDLHRLSDWAEESQALMAGAEAVGRARDLAIFGTSLLARYEAEKAARGLLDFDDLVLKTRDLLTRADLAEWVLFKLDGGIDHLLVDEAQDTNPEQWEVVAALTAEFHAGEGAGRTGRTVFVVGDEKQSIYSFQGADPRRFGEMRGRFRTRISGTGAALREPALVTSFRSARGILDFVDAVFAGGGGLTLDGGAPVHAAARGEEPGRVDLWPLLAKRETADKGPWDAPLDRAAESHHHLRLAAALATQIARHIGRAMLPAREGRAARPLRPGDVMVLVQKRDLLARGLIRALKARGVPVAGADRMVLSEELAARDLMAALKIAATPGDDLSLAALLRSPLCGVGEEALLTLAHGRKGTLRQAVIERAEEFPDAAALLDMLWTRAEFEPPFELLSRILGAHDGRRKLLARLGAEAEDPIDELLAQALDWEGRETPTLAAFIAWIEGGEERIRREMDRSGDAVRVMTVHGAKGLEAPLVILPDTAKRKPGNRVKLFETPAGAPLWPGPSASDDPVTAAARSEAAAREEAERDRLLYVALTRAEDWLILAGAGDPEGDAGEGSWYSRLSAAMEAMGGGARETPPGMEAPLRRLGPDPEAGAAAPVASAQPRPEQPQWLCKAVAEDRAKRSSPSTLVEHAESGGAGLGREAARAYGNAVHLLLERLPALPPETRGTAADRLIAAPDIRARALDEALAALALPEATAFFGPEALAEASLALDPPEPGGLRMIGRIDRLLVLPDRVRFLDIKTDAAPPSEAEAVPAAYLAQLSAYAGGLAAIYPDRPVEAAILWTAIPRLMEIPGALLSTAAVSAA